MLSNIHGLSVVVQGCAAVDMHLRKLQVTVVLQLESDVHSSLLQLLRLNWVVLVLPPFLFRFSGFRT